MSAMALYYFSLWRCPYIGKILYIDSLVLSLVSDIHWGSWNISHTDKASTVYPEMELLDTMAVLFLSLQGTPSALYDCTNICFHQWCKICLFSTALSTLQFSSVTRSCPNLCDPMDCSTQAYLSITNSWSLLKLMSIKSVMPSNHLILCHPLLLLPSIFPSIRVFSNESILSVGWPKYWSFSFSISPCNEY